MTKAAIFIGSISDEDKMRPCAEVLASLGIGHLFTAASAHRTPERVQRLVKDLEEQGCKVFICAAGMAAHLAGAVAAKTIRPVLGVPLTASALEGMDALLATVQMPPGLPVGPWPWTAPECATRLGWRPKSWPWRMRPWPKNCARPGKNRSTAWKGPPRTWSPAQSPSMRK